MINIPTVFILGAGASNDYGYPLGTELRDRILHFSGNTEWISDLALEIKRKSKIPINLNQIIMEIEAFNKAFRESSIVSIDRFLDKRKEFIDIGKIYIAKVILSHEYNDDRLANVYGWYSYLWNIMTNKCNRIHEVVKNKISFITFNYDRSLEKFLYNSLKASFGCTDREADDIVEMIPIIHVHGVCGFIPEQINKGKRKNSTECIYEYGSATSWYKAIEASHQIRVVHERKLDEETKDQIHKLFTETENICFLGFGYDEDNLELIRPSALDRKNIQGTGLGINKVKLNELKSEHNAFQRIINVDKEYQNINMFLSNKVHL